MTTDIVERLRASLEMSHHLQLRYEAAAEIERLRTLARDAYEATPNAQVVRRGAAGGASERTEG